jgi:hypothetical protein
MVALVFVFTTTADPAAPEEQGKIWFERLLLFVSLFPAVVCITIIFGWFLFIRIE